MHRRARPRRPSLRTTRSPPTWRRSASACSAAPSPRWSWRPSTWVSASGCTGGCGSPGPRPRRGSPSTSASTSATCEGLEQQAVAQLVRCEDGGAAPEQGHTRRLAPAGTAVGAEVGVRDPRSPRRRRPPPRGGPAPKKSPRLSLTTLRNLVVLSRAPAPTPTRSPCTQRWNGWPPAAATDWSPTVSRLRWRRRRSGCPPMPRWQPCGPARPWTTCRRSPGVAGPPSTGSPRLTPAGWQRRTERCAPTTLRRAQSPLRRAGAARLARAATTSPMPVTSTAAPANEPSSQRRASGAAGLPTPSRARYAT